MDRRTFLKDAGIFLGLLGLETSMLPQLAAALEEMATGRAPVLWLQGQACSGCSMSLLNADSPGPEALITRYLSLYFHHTLSAATGEAAGQAIERAIDHGGYILVAEGAVPNGMLQAGRSGHETYRDQLLRAARKAKIVVSVGACACFGGIPAAPPNPTGATSVETVLKQHGVPVPLVHIPGCPAHPAWIVGTLIHLLKVGVPPLDEHRRPRSYFGQQLHEQCQYFASYQSKKFALMPGDQGCMFKIGCLGPVTWADCSLRGWNSGVNWCVRSRAVCAGCARPDFAQNPDLPFYRLNEEPDNAKQRS